MGIKEAVRQIQEENGKKATEAGAEKLSREQESKDFWDKHYAFLDTQEKKLLEETRLSEKLQEIVEILVEQKIANHKLSQKRSYALVSLQLAWDFSPSQIKDNWVVGDNFKSVDVGIRLDTEVITLNGHEVSNEQWRKDQSLLETELAKAFLSPNRNPPSQGPMYETGWS